MRFTHTLRRLILPHVHQNFQFLLEWEFLLYLEVSPYLKNAIRKRICHRNYLNQL